MEHLRPLVDAMPIAIVVVSHTGRIRMLNEPATTLFGYTAGEADGMPVDRLVPVRFGSEHPSLRADYLEAPTPRPMGAGRELFGLRKDGSEVPIEIGLNPIATSEGNFVLAVVIDISERKRAEELRLANAGMLEHNRQLEALNDELESFTYTVSHDLRAPVRAVLGYARVVREEYGAALDSEGARLLGIVHDEAARMGELIDELLAFSRFGRQPMESVPIDMPALVNDVVARLELTGDRSSAIVDVGPLPNAIGDRALLRQVWMNLIGNAIKYSSRQQGPHVDVSGSADAGIATYQISDNGVGFDMRYAGKLFGVFQRLHRVDEFPGTGVGLAIVHRILLRHGGTIRAEAAPGKGATFTFTLPQRITA